MSLIRSATLTSLLLAPILLTAPSATAQQGPSEETIQQDLKLARKEVLAKRPYKLDPSRISEVINVNVIPSQQRAVNVPDWWSEKQAYDIATLLSLALSNYSSFRVATPKTWEDHIVDMNTSSQAGEPTGQPTGQPSGQPIKRKNFLNSRTINAQVDILDYVFQYMPVKRRGIGLGFIALTSKECSSETFLQSSASIRDVQSGEPALQTASGTSTNLESLLGSQSLPLSRRIVNTTGGASLNFNFLVGGAGGGNFNPPDKPLKQIIYETVADAAEAMYCLATDQTACIDYYRTRPQPLPTKLTTKQRKKVQSC